MEDLVNDREDVINVPSALGTNYTQPCTDCKAVTRTSTAQAS